MTRVYLVGAGPGDPELITVKGKRVLALADVVLYDHLASEALLDHAPPHAERIYVGKKKSVQSRSQEEIIALMIELAQSGKTVVRLKGGDPFIFGRGGEEVEALAEVGIPYQVVPGVTAPLGIAAYTGVPLTHREHTSVVTFVTGHDVTTVDWRRFGISETLVIFMGLHFVREITRELLESGRSPGTPAMAVRWGTRADQRTVTGTLSDLADRIAESGLTPPATIIIGDVVSLRSKLTWFEKLPLFGQRIVVTRARSQAGELSSLLREQGAEAIELPVIELVPVDFDEELNVEQYDWAVFTSVNAVEFFFSRLEDVRRLRARLCAIGPATRRAIEARGLPVDLSPAEATSEGVASAFAGEHLAGSSILLPRAAAARDVIPEALRSLGANVKDLPVYRNVIPRDAEQRARNLFSGDRKPHWIIFASASAVKNLVALTGAAKLSGVRIAVIGPVTAHAARMHGLSVTAEASEPSAEAVVNAIRGSITSS